MEMKGEAILVMNMTPTLPTLLLCSSLDENCFQSYVYLLFYVTVMTDCLSRVNKTLSNMITFLLTLVLRQLAFLTKFMNLMWIGTCYWPILSRPTTQQIEHIYTKF
jgi:hypothetical protein